MRNRWPVCCILGLCVFSPPSETHRAPTASACNPALGPFLFGPRSPLIVRMMRSLHGRLSRALRKRGDLGLGQRHWGLIWRAAGAYSENGDNCPMQLGAEYKRTETKFLVPHTGDAVCTVCGAALESWWTSTHIPSFELVKRPGGRPPTEADPSEQN